MASSSPHNNAMSSPAAPPSPPQTAAGAGGVRRYHTISAHGRSTRSTSRTISEENLEQSGLNEDEYIVPGEEWVAPGVGAVGEKSSSLHRQTSLPTKYHSHRAGYQSQGRQSGPSTPLRTMNSLSAIQAEHGIDGEGEEEWEAEMRGLRNSESETYASSQQVSGAAPPLSPPFVPAEAPSPPPVPSGAGVRRHQSLTYGPNHNTGANLRRTGTTAGVKPRRNNTIGVGTDVPSGSTLPESPSPDTEEHFVEEEAELEEQLLPQMPSLQQPQPQVYTSNSGGRSPWSTPGPPEWRGANILASSNNAYMPGSTPVSVMDDVQRALSTLELSSAGTSPRVAPQMIPMNNAQQGISQPPRFANQNIVGAKGINLHGNGLLSSDSSTELPPNVGGVGLQNSYGPGSYVSLMGHGSSVQQQSNNRMVGSMGGMNIRQGVDDEQGSGTGVWEHRALTPRSSNPNLQNQNQLHQNWVAPPPVPSIPQQYLQPQPQHQQAPRLAGMNYGGQQTGGNGGQLINSQGNPAYLGSPIDVPTLIKTKGYNPTTFDIRPSFARYFVIKSYTEDDVHKSLKYEIWSSTDPGNKRLDKAFKEVNGRGPIYLFFSVNASGHFCGMAEMLTPVDYTRSSTVWASDKWKGVFKVRWVFVRDIPNANLRHIRLNNTQERKPVTNSRDTQELLPEAGHEMLRIFFTHPARTSLLQDFAYYELQSLQRSQSPPTPENPSSQQVNPSVYGVPQQPYLQSVMRNPSPSPSGNYGMNAGNYSVQ